MRLTINETEYATLLHALEVSINSYTHNVSMARASGCVQIENELTATIGRVEAIKAELVNEFESDHEHPAMRELLRRIAKAENRADEIEIYDDAPVSSNDSGDGAYVQAWVWVDTPKCSLCKEPLTEPFATIVSSGEDEYLHPACAKEYKESTAWPWCKACQSWHHPDNPTCFKLTGQKARPK